MEKAPSALHPDSTDELQPLPNGGSRRFLDAVATVISVGNKIRELRASRDLTLQGLADRTGLSSSMLSLVERGKTSPSIGTLVAIASALGVHMTDLLDDQAPKRSEPVSRRADQASYKTAEGVERQVLKTDDLRGVELVFNEYAPGTGSSGGPVHHSGYEYGIVFEGNLIVEVSGSRYEVGPGDCISYESSLPHKIFNEGKRQVRALWINLER